MQVEIETKPKVYEPNTLKITFETEEEYLMFVEMFSFDISIPEVVYPESNLNRIKLTEQMLKIRKVLLT